MIKHSILGILILLAVGNSFAFEATPKETCITATSGVADILAIVMQGRCTEMSDTEIRAKADKKLSLKPLPFELKSEDFKMIISAGSGNKNLAICGVAAEKLLGIKGSADRLAASNIPEEVKKKLAAHDETVRKFKEKTDLELAKAREIKDPNGRRVAEALIEDISSLFLKDSARGRESILSFAKSAASYTPQQLKTIQQWGFDTMIYSAGYVDICNPGTLAVSDADKFNFDSAYIAKMVDLAVNYEPGDSWFGIYRSEGVLSDSMGVLKGQYTNQERPQPPLKGLSRNFDPKVNSVWKELVTTGFRSRDIAFAGNNPKLIIDTYAGSAISLSELAVYEGKDRSDLRVKNLYSASAADVTSKMRVLGLTEARNFSNGSKRLVVFTSPTAVYTIAFTQNANTLTFSSAAPSFAMLSDLQRMKFVPANKE